MDSLRIHLFGTMQVYCGGTASPVAMARVPKVLLAYLLLQPDRLHPRPILANLLWGDRSEEQARNCLNTALWRLRRVLEPEGAGRGRVLLTTPGGEIGLKGEGSYWLDVAELERRVAGALGRPPASWTAGDAAQVEEAVQLYTGDLLEGLYEDWALRERERLRELYFQGLGRLMGYYRQQGDLANSRRCGQKILAVDPLREEVHRALMGLYWEQGQRTAALQQYRICCELLERELGVPPMAETEALAQRITSAGAAGAGVVQASPAAVGMAAGAPAFGLAVQEVERALRCVAEANAAVQAAVLLLRQVAASL